MSRFSREEREAFAAAIADAGPEGSAAFFPRLARELQRKGVTIPTATIEFTDLTVVAQASSSAKALPSLPNVVTGLAKAITLQHDKPQPLTILNHLSGELKPGRLTLLLAPPSSGKTTFLRALAGRLPRNAYTGQVAYNGVSVHDFCAARTVAFVAQTNHHIANLTAQETVDFTYKAQHNPQGSSFQPDLSGESQQGEKPGKLSHVAVHTLAPGAALETITGDAFAQLARAALVDGGRVDTVMQFFDLARCKDTFVGNEMMRGISGGERKRLSTVEMLQGPQRVLILDEISTGLDAATLFAVIRWLRSMTEHLKLTAVVSLLQPPPETFELFQDLILMNQGTIVYHGAVRGAVPFMDQLGFSIPPRKDVASFLQEVTTVKGQLMHANAALRDERGIAPDLDVHDDLAVADLDLLVPLEQMADSYTRGEVDKARGHAGAQKADSGKDGPGFGALVPDRERYPLPALAALKMVLARSWTLFMREPTLTRARIVQVVVMGLLIGGLWFGREASAEDARILMSAVFLIVMFVAFGGMAQLAVSLQNRPVWFKQRDVNLYTASTYAWSMALVQVPLSIVESLIFASITYFMIGFTRDSPKYFFIFCAVLCSASLAVTSVFRAIGAFFHAPAVANSVAGFILLMLILNSGFIIVYEAIPPWVVGFYWISPFAYSVRAAVVNEFTSPRWSVTPPGAPPGVTMGSLALGQLDFHEDRKWIWIGIAFNVAAFCVITQITALALKHLHAPKEPVVLRSKEEVKASLEAARKARTDAHKFLQRDPSVAGQAQVPSAGVARPDAPKSVGETLSFTPITVVWKNLSYYVPVPKGLTGSAAFNIMPDTADPAVAGKKRLLDDITGYTEPAVLTALMGGSGAGKTTLMDVLAGRKTQGVIQGDLLVNGHPKDQASWARVVGYVEQTDVHSAALTVGESLQFSAGLRLDSSVRQEVRDAFVLEVLVVTELLDIRDNLVGTPGESGLSVEQRRRLSIGVELVANPSVVFLDEPTSGLDARSANAVMAAVRNLAGNGRTVMVTIHQPSIEIFETFDRLVLLGMGGKPIFGGSLGGQSCNLVDYFQAIPGVARLPGGYNPATWMLEISGGGTKMHFDSVDVDFSARFKASELHLGIVAEADNLVKQCAGEHGPLTLSSLYAANLGKQFHLLLWKQMLVYWRTPSYTVARVFVTILTGVIFGMTYWQEGTLPTSSSKPISLANIQNVLGALYSGVTFTGMTNLQAGVPVFLAERQVMYRERAAGMYAILPFSTATGIVELPYLALQVVIFVPILYFMVGFSLQWDAFLLFLVVFFESITLYTYMGQMFAYLMPTATLAVMAGAMNHFLWNIFNGFLVPGPLMARGFVWLNYISATTYVVYGLGVAQLGAEERKVVVPGYPGCPGQGNAALTACPTVKEFLEDYFGYYYEMRWWCAAILLAFLVVFRIAAMLALQYINHLKR